MFGFCPRIQGGLNFKSFESRPAIFRGEFISGVGRGIPISTDTYGDRLGEILPITPDYVQGDGGDPTARWTPKARGAQTLPSRVKGWDFDLPPPAYLDFFGRWGPEKRGGKKNREKSPNSGGGILIPPKLTVWDGFSYFAG